MGKIGRESLRRVDLANVTIVFKSGLEVQYYNIDVLEIGIDEAGLRWLDIYWETKNNKDTIKIPLENIDEIHFVEGEGWESKDHS